MLKTPLILSLVSILIIIVSCQKPEKACSYDWDKKLNDTNLYISLTVDQKDYKLFQIELGAVPSSVNTFLTYNGKSIYNNDYNYFFGGSEDLHSFTLTFWDTSLVTNNNVPMKGLAKRIKKSYVFTYPRRDRGSLLESLPTDTAFMNGVSLTLTLPDYVVFSTKNLMNYFNYDYDTIYNYILKNSRFSITSVEPACNGFNIIKGEFSTLLMNSPIAGSPRITLLLEGKFKIVSI